jgi:hypothetical protein
VEFLGLRWAVGFCFGDFVWFLFCILHYWGLNSGPVLARQVLCCLTHSPQPSGMFFVFAWDRVSLWSLGWVGIHLHPASASPVQVWDYRHIATTLGPALFL